MIRARVAIIAAAVVAAISAMLAGPILALETDLNGIRNLSETQASASTITNLSSCVYQDQSNPFAKRMNCRAMVRAIMADATASNPIGTGTLLPTTDNIFDIGSTSKRWRLFLGVNARLTDLVSCAAISSDSDGDLACSASVPGSALTVQDAAGDTTTFCGLWGSTTGSLPGLTDAGCSYQATTNVLTVTGGVVASLTGNASTATALAANGGNCSGNNFALGVDASGVGECAQPAFSNLSGSATDAQVPDSITITGPPTINANLTGPITSVGNATSIASQTGTGTTFAMSAGPTFTTLTDSALTSGRVTFASTAGLLADDSTLLWDNTNKWLGIGATPAFVLHATAGAAQAARFEAARAGSGVLTGNIASLYNSENAAVPRGAFLLSVFKDAGGTARNGASMGGEMVDRTAAAVSADFVVHTSNVGTVAERLRFDTVNAQLRPATAGAWGIGGSALGISGIYFDEAGAGTQTTRVIASTLAADTVATLPPITSNLLGTAADGATTEVLVGGGASALPVWTTATGTGAPVRAGSPTGTGTWTLPIVKATSLNATLGGTELALPTGGVAMFTNRSAAGDSAIVGINSGSSGNATLRLYNNGTNNGYLRASSASLYLGYDESLATSLASVSFVNSTDTWAIQDTNGNSLLRMVGSAGTEGLSTHSKFLTYGNVGTAGAGVVPIRSESISATKTANFTAASLTPPATAGRYRVGAVITTTSATNTGTLQVTVDYKDSQGTAHTADILPIEGAAGTYATTATSAASKEFSTAFKGITIDNSATAIVLKVVIVGVVSYTVAPVIEQIG